MRYPGDIANQPATCVVLRVYTDRWGTFFDAKEESGALSFDREFLGMSIGSLSPGPQAWLYLD